MNKPDKTTGNQDPAEQLAALKAAELVKEMQLMAAAVMQEADLPRAYQGDVVDECQARQTMNLLNNPMWRRRMAVSSLKYHVDQGDYAAVVRELELDSNLLSVSANNQPWLHRAVKKGQADIIKLFLQHGVNANECNDEGQTALVISATYGCLSSALILLDHGADPALASRSGALPIVEFSRYSGVGSILKRLVDMGVDPNSKDAANQTDPLTMAAYAGHEDTVRTLLYLGAKPEIGEDGRCQLVDDLRVGKIDEIADIIEGWIGASRAQVAIKDASSSLASNLRPLFIPRR